MVGQGVCEMRREMWDDLWYNLVRFTLKTQHVWPTLNLLHIVFLHFIVMITNQNEGSNDSKKKNQVSYGMSMNFKLVLGRARKLIRSILSSIPKPQTGFHNGQCGVQWYDQIRVMDMTAAFNARKCRCFVLWSTSTYTYTYLQFCCQYIYLDQLHHHHFHLHLDLHLFTQLLYIRLPRPCKKMSHRHHAQEKLWAYPTKSNILILYILVREGLPVQKVPKYRHCIN